MMKVPGKRRRNPNLDVQDRAVFGGLVLESMGRGGRRTVFEVAPGLVQAKVAQIPGIAGVRWRDNPPFMPAAGQFPVEVVIRGTGRGLRVILEFAQALQAKKRRPERHVRVSHPAKIDTKVGPARGRS